MYKKENFRDFFKRTIRFNNIFILLIGSPVIYLFIILSLYVHIMYIILFLGFTLLSGLLLYCFWRSSQRPSKRDRTSAFLIFGTLLFVFTLFPFSFIHEMGHALEAISRGVPILSFFVRFFGTGQVEVPPSTPAPDMTMISIAGSLGVIILNMIILAIISKRKYFPQDVVFSIFIISGFHIMDEIKYWITSIIKNSDDAGVFLSVNPSINPDWLLMVCRFAFYIMGFSVLSLWLYNYLNREMIEYPFSVMEYL